MIPKIVYLSWVKPKYPLVNLCQNIYRNLDLHTPKARSITTLVLACAILYFSSACVDGFNFGVIRYCLSPYPESPRSHPLALLVSSIWNIAELQNMKESCTDPGHLQTIFVNLKKRRFVSTNIYIWGIYCHLVVHNCISLIN